MKEIRDKFFEVGTYDNQDVLLVDVMYMNNKKLKFSKEVWLEEKRKGLIKIRDIIYDERKEEYLEIESEKDIKECIYSLGNWKLYKKVQFK